MLELKYTKVSREFQEEYFSKWLALLPSSLAEKIKRYRFWKDAQSTLFGYLLISKELLSDNYKRLSEIDYNNFGKPFLPNNFFFNISHSGSYVVFISCRKENIGIDIEEIDNNIKVSDFFALMTKKEQFIIKTSNDKPKAFYSYWTQKEATIKANGKGLSIPLKSFEINDNKTYIESKQYFTKEILLNKKYVCYLSSTMNDIEFSIEEVSFLKNP